jgi:N-acetylglucosamine transport system substrate-binding protein
MVPKQAKHPKLAKEFLSFLYSDASIERFARHANGVLALTGALEKAKPFMQPDVYSMYSLLEDEKVVAYLLTFPSPSVSSTSFVLGGMSVDEWADGIQRQMLVSQRENEGF